MRRREFIGAVGGAAIAWPIVARAQRSAMPVIGFIDSRSVESVGNRLVGFRQGLQQAGYTEGQSVAIEYRWGENQMDRVPELTADLVRQQVDVIVASGGTPVTFAAKRAATKIPVVFLAAQDPVKLGLVSSLARPDGNLTGVNFFNTELAVKQFELLHEIVPSAARIAVLVDPADRTNTEPVVREVEDAARANSLNIEIFKANNSREIDETFEAIARGAS
jgi:putative ABC transport system substrate-binding protein